MDAPEGRRGTRPIVKPRVQWLRTLLAALVATQVTACSRTVHWEEEVPLNTGEVIVVKRVGAYEFESESGNPLRFAYRPQWRSTIEFTYNGKRYSHTDDASLVLLAIAPNGSPTLVAEAANHDWAWKHKYNCVTPSYVQFSPDESGERWTWPKRIDAWLHNQPTNLIFGLVPLEAQGKTFKASDRAKMNLSLTVMFKELSFIDPAYSEHKCQRTY